LLTADVTVTHFAVADQHRDCPTMRMYRSAMLLAAGAGVISTLAVTIKPSAEAATVDTRQQTWHENLFTADATGVNVTGTGGRIRITDPTARLGTQPGPNAFLITPVRPVPTPVDRVGVDVVATVPAGAAVTVEVRGSATDGRWSEWTAADPTAVLRRPATALQFRLSLSGGPAGGPSVSDLSVRASRESTVASDVSTQSLSYRLFATREGLVGGRTANGHIIANRDHFVALPSRRGLNATAGARTYQVQVCYPKTGRCETAPVWDVGPWNTTDDYWNASSARQSWTNLPQGMPSHRRPISTATTADATSSAVRCSIRPASTSPTAPSGTASG
jgi:hypothetical protein